MYILLLYACNSTEDINVPPPVVPSKQELITKQQNPAPNPGALPGLSPAEDLSTSWNPEFAVEVKQVSADPECKDADGDGFVDARQCGDSRPNDKIDCNDDDASIGPEQERYVRSSPFLMGSNSDHAGADESPVHVVQMSGYCLDKTEVSSQDFSQWLVQNQRKPNGADLRNITEDGNLEDGRGAYPVEGATWKEARDYCQSLGKSLPTEAQWEKAARGGCELGDDQLACDIADLRAYPWGNDTPSCTFANHQLSASGMPKLCVSDTVQNDDLAAGTGPYGHVHLAGNVWEYVQDVWHPNVYANGRNNPAGPKEGDIHVLRGGGWNTFSTNMRAANRFHDLVMGSAAGFRCARSFTDQNYDDIEQLILETVSGQIQSSLPLKGRALYVTAFDARDADASGMLAPGRSPIAEIKLSPNGLSQQSFSIKLPTNGSYILSAALDAGTGGQKENYVSASGSGGFGQAKGNPIQVKSAVTDILIEIKAPPAHGAMPAPGSQKRPPGHPPGQKPNQPPQNRR